MASGGFDRRFRRAPEVLVRSVIGGAAVRRWDRPRPTIFVNSLGAAIIYACSEFITLHELKQAISDELDGPLPTEDGFENFVDHLHALEIIETC